MRALDETAFLFGSAEKEADVWDLIDHVVCLVVDNPTLRQRLLTRTTNAFGKQPDELAAALARNDTAETRYRRLNATIIDGTLPPSEVVDAVLAAAAGTAPEGRPR